MLIFGHPFLQFEHFYHIHDIDAITKTPSSCILFIEFHENNLDIIKHVQLNDLDFALEVKTLKDAIFGENLGAKYIICEKDIAKSIQNRAEHYLFDAKILCRVEDDEEIEVLALEGIDGVVYGDAVIKVV